MRMLKHVSHRSSSSSLSRSCDHSFRSIVGHGSPDGYPSISEIDAYNSYRRNDDSVSLVSALSFSSLAVSGRFCSRTSSTISLNDHATVPVKIYLRRLRSDMEYKTVSLSLQTTCKELILLLLNKFRLRHRDPNLFFVLMEVTVRSPSDGAPVKRQLVLEANARPAELQQCRPKGEANFSIGVRRGGLVRVHDSILMPGSQYKSLMVSYKTTSEDVIRLVLNCYNSKDDVAYYCLHEACKVTGLDRQMKQDEFPIQIQASWPKESKSAWSFVLKPNVRFNLMKSMGLWRRSLDQSSTDTESEPGDHDTTRASIMSSSSTISHSSTSSGVSSSSCCSSSGVSSSDCDSLILSPVRRRSPSSVTLTPEAPQSKPPARPPKPVPRTLFPSLHQKASCSSDEDSGIVLEDDFSPVKADKRNNDTAPVIPVRTSRVPISHSPDENNPEARIRSSSNHLPSTRDDHHEKPVRSSSISSPSRSEGTTPEVPIRSSSISTPVPTSKTNSKFARIKSLSKSSVDLKTLASTSSTSHSKSTLNLNFKGLFIEKTLSTSSPSKCKPPMATSTPSNRSSLFRPEFKSLSPLKLRLSTSLTKESSCACKSCFYI